MLHSTVRVWTSASSSAWFWLSSSPELTAEPPYGHSRLVAGSVRTTTSGEGGGVVPCCAVSLHAPTIAAPTIAAPATHDRQRNNVWSVRGRRGFAALT